MMSVDRYVAVCHPVKALDLRTPLMAKTINVGIWVLSSAAGVPAMVLGGTQTNNGELGWNYTRPGFKVIQLVLDLVLYI